MKQKVLGYRYIEIENNAEKYHGASDWFRWVKTSKYTKNLEVTTFWMALEVFQALAKLFIPQGLMVDQLFGREKMDKISLFSLLLHMQDGEVKKPAMNPVY